MKYETRYVDQQKDIDEGVVLIAPHDEFRGASGPILMPEGISLYKWGKDNSDLGCTVGIDVRSGEYRVADLRDVNFWLPILWVANEAGLPFVINLLSSYVYSRLPAGVNRGQEIINVQVRYKETKTTKTREVDYQGPVSGLKDILDGFRD